MVAEESKEGSSTTKDAPSAEPIPEKSTEKSESSQRAPAVPAANIFGAAKPVDTTAREREIEERLAKSYAESRSREETYVGNLYRWVTRCNSLFRIFYLIFVYD